MASIAEVKSTVKGKASKYRAQVRRKGQKVISKTFTTRADAVKWGKTFEAKAELGQVEQSNESGKHTLSDLITRYIEDTDSNNKRKGHLDWWNDEIGYMLLSDINRATISEKINKLTKSPKRHSGKVKYDLPGTVISPATVNRYHAAISAVFKHGMNPLFWIESNPAKIQRQTEPKGIVRYLDEDEKASLLMACEASEWGGLLPMVWLALSTGARQGNILNLRWSQIDLKAGTASVSKTKNGDPIVLPLVGNALNALKKWNKVRNIQSDWVFPSIKMPSKPYADFRKHWMKAVSDAELKSHFRFHDLRHTTASYLAKAGVNQSTIMSVMGHKTLAASQRYMHLDVEDNRKALEKVFGS